MQQNDSQTTKNIMQAFLIMGVLSALLYGWHYRWHDDKGNFIHVPRCFPWQTVEDRCDEFNVPCGDGFKPGELCTHGKLFAPGE